MSWEEWGGVIKRNLKPENRCKFADVINRGSARSSLKRRPFGDFGTNRKNLNVKETRVGKGGEL